MTLSLITPSRDAKLFLGLIAPDPLSKSHTKMETTPNSPPPSQSHQGTPIEPPAQSPGPKNDKTMGMLCHLLAFAQFLVPLGNIIGPLAVWLAKKESDPFVDACGKESLNFQISMTIYLLFAFSLILVGIGLFLVPIIMVINIVCVIIASIKASEGTSYRYPITIRLIN